MRLIEHKIRLISLKRLIYAAVMLFITCCIFYYIPFFDVVWPAKITDPTTIVELYQNDIACVELTVDTLYYSGYDYMENGKVTGSYYYNLYNGTCIYFLLSNAQCNNRQDILTKIPIKARLESGGKLLSSLIQKMSADLNWTPQGLSAVSSHIIINAMDYLLVKNIALLIATLLVFSVSLLVLIKMICYMAYPILHPACFRLRHYGPIKEQIKLAEFELGQEPILKKGIFTITEHFLIASSKIQLYLLPLDKIVWVYKHSSLHRLSFKHVHITYTLRVIAKKKLKLVASMQPKEDVDAVIDHISAYCPDALINYSRENEQLARVRQQL
ncbi:MAG: hypothetical protein HFG39_00755 [Lachnospiraceae bacterium]|nr:hypothetical protein [Lachnospiraceae bacterium]